MQMAAAISSSHGSLVADARYECAFELLLIALQCSHAKAWLCIAAEAATCEIKNKHNSNQWKLVEE
jgi:hypothetical protein